MGGNPTPRRDGTAWSREELILAFDLYCRIPFNRTKANNPQVISLATVLGRTPASIARKLGNFGAFDPELRRRQISGLTHTSKLDRKIWDEFNASWGRLVLEAEDLKKEFGDPVSAKPSDNLFPEEHSPTEREALVKQRIHQNFFRATVLSGYNQRCCICGLPHAELLVAGHIIPWGIREDTRVNPANGLCFCASHDKAYDRGLIGINMDFTVIVTTRLKQSTDPASEFLFHTFNGKHITLPDRFTPKVEFLQWRFNRFDQVV